MNTVQAFPEVPGAIVVGALVVIVTTLLYWRFSVDLVALALLFILVAVGEVSAVELFAGFSSPVVIVYMCSLFVAGALRATGVSDSLARLMSTYAGTRERGIILAVFFSSALLSGFINNVSAATLLMPTVAVLVGSTQISPSRLFMPLAFGVTLGGTLTLIGTPANLLASELLVRHGLQPLSFFELTPYGAVIVCVTAMFFFLAGAFLLPHRKTYRQMHRIAELRSSYRAQDRLFAVRVPEGSPVAGNSLGYLRFGSLVEGRVITILRDGRKVLAPKADEVLGERDLLLVRGDVERFKEVIAFDGVVTSTLTEDIARRIESCSQIVRVTIREVHTEARMTTLREVLRYMGVVPLSLSRAQGQHAWEAHPPAWFLDYSVHKNDTLIGCIAGRFSEDVPILDSEIEELPRGYEGLRDSLYVITVKPEGWSGAPLHRFIHETHIPLVGRIGEKDEIEWLDVPVLQTGGGVAPANLTADHILRAGERYLVAGSVEEGMRRGVLSTLHLEGDASPSESESEEVELIEAVVMPKAEHLGRTLADLHLWEKFESRVLALWRHGRPHLSLSSTLPVMSGDALVMQGPSQSLPLLAKEPELLVLSEHRTTRPLSAKSGVAIFALLLLIVIPSLGIPVHEAAFVCAGLVVLTGAVSMEEMYGDIEWRTVFLLALMIPLGIAMERACQSAAFASVLSPVGALLPYPMVLGSLLMVATVVVSQVVDGTVAVVLLGPVALSLGAQDAQLARTLLMTVTLGSSLAFLAPGSSQANQLVVGAGGYKRRDFLRVGLPLTLVTAAAVLIALWGGS